MENKPGKLETKKRQFIDRHRRVEDSQVTANKEKLNSETVLFDKSERSLHEIVYDASGKHDYKIVDVNPMYELLPEFQKTGCRQKSKQLFM